MLKKNIVEWVGFPKIWCNFQSGSWQMLTSDYKAGGWGEKRPKTCLHNISKVPKQVLVNAWLWKTYKLVVCSILNSKWNVLLEYIMASIFTSLLTLVSGPWANPKAGAVELKMPVTGFDLGRNSSPNALNFLCCCWWCIEQSPLVSVTIHSFFKQYSNKSRTLNRKLGKSESKGSLVENARYWIRSWEELIP